MVEEFERKKKKFEKLKSQKMLACELSTYPSGRIAHPFSHLKKVGKFGGHYSARQRRISTVGNSLASSSRRIV